MIFENEDFYEGTPLMEKLRGLELDGRSGAIEFPYIESNDRKEVGYKVVNWQEMSAAGIKTAFYYEPSRANV